MKTILKLPQPPTMILKPRRALHPLIARSGASSDMCVLDQIFLCDEYSPLRSIECPKLILDLGANVGYSSAYFLSCFPSADVIAVEPDPRNVEICRRNLAPYGNRARIIKGAIWSEQCRLKLARSGYADGRDWATQVLPVEDAQDEEAVEGWDVESLLQLAGKQQIDLLKIDIERSELELFGAGSRLWLEKVRNLCIELHGLDCERVFFKAVSDFEYDLSTHAELTICKSIRRKPPSLEFAN